MHSAISFSSGGDSTIDTNCMICYIRRNYYSTVAVAVPVACEIPDIVKFELLNY